MPVEAQVKMPRSAAENRTSEWLDRVETSAESAYATLVGLQRGELALFTSEMESASRESLGLAATPEMMSRLNAIKERLTILRSMLRQAAAFVEARELEKGSVLGYTPRGWERAL
jgi:hypothetical protein